MDSGSFFVGFICRSRICAPVYAVFPAGMVSFPPKNPILGNFSLVTDGLPVV